MVRDHGGCDEKREGGIERSCGLEWLNLKPSENPL